ncbi:MAG: TRAP transporter substrate-binding protein [Proteobacteria bacterium]|nr:MAG: TRAP transporter substrate-binding protein [Pseudomonadota bacterium]
MQHRIKIPLNSLGQGRRSALKLLAGSGLVANLPELALAQNNKFALKLAISLSESHPTVIGLRAACAKILEETHGQLVVEVFPNGQLGSDSDTISQVRSGAIDLVCTTGAAWSTLIPAAAVPSAPFAFVNSQSAFAAMDGGLGAHIHSAFGKANLVQIGKTWDHGYRHITTSTRPIIAVQDLRGVKLRVPATAVLQMTFKALGASPTSIPLGEAYTALQTRVVDGQENPLAIIEAQRFYEVQKYCSLTGHSWDGVWIAANPRVWNTVPESLRQIAIRVLDDHAVATRAALALLSMSLRESLAQKGIVFNAVDVKPFREALNKAGTYKELQGKFGKEGWALLENQVGVLA